MPIRRRLLLAALPTLLVRPALAQRADPRMNERVVGRDDAALTVQEWFSLTCTHCAHFSEVVFEEVRAKLIDTGRIRYVFRDFPLDQLALTAAMVARTLPPDRYLPFVETLLATQDSWAFDRSADPLERLGRQAALAGMSPQEFRSVLADQNLKTEILQEQEDGQKRYDIAGTPTFVFGNRKIGSIATYEAFAAAVATASK